MVYLLTYHTAITKTFFTFKISYGLRYTRICTVIQDHENIGLPLICFQETHKQST